MLEENSIENLMKFDYMILLSPINKSNNKLIRKDFNILINVFMTEENLPQQTDYTEIDAQIRDIIRKAVRYMPNADSAFVASEITRAYLYARDAHEGQFRQS